MSKKKTKIIALAIILAVAAVMYALSVKIIACGLLGGCIANAYMVFFEKQKEDK